MNKNNQYLIYKHTNLITNQSYIGITTHIDDPNKRWKNGYGYYNQKKFFNAIQEFGWNNFSHDILETNISPADIDQKEQEYIKKYDSYYNGYNSTPGGLTMTEEQRIALSQALIGIKRSQESIEKQLNTKINRSGWGNGSDPINSKLTKRVRCKETGDVFGSIAEANNWSNTSKVRECCVGIKQHAGRHPDTNELLSWEFVSKDTPVTIRCQNKRTTNKIKKVMCIETNIIYNSASEAARSTGCHVSNILKACKGVLKTTHGLHWKFID